MKHLQKRPVKRAKPAASTRRQWAAQINAAWRKSVAAIFETGRILIAAKTKLIHGEFLKMCDTDLPFSPSTAQRLMAIAADRKLSNPAHVQYLPPSWGTLYELTKLSDTEFAARIKSGLIHPQLERRDVVPSITMAGRSHPVSDLDFSPTPPWATRALIERVLPQISDVDFALCQQTVWEPACGEGHMAEVLREYFRAVKASDVHDYGYGEYCDFLADKTDSFVPPRGAFDWIITNPPFDDKAERFTLRALDLARSGVAIFVQLRFLETIGRYERLFRPFPPTIVAIFVERVPLHMGRWEPDGDTLTAYMWLVWIKDRKSLPPFWIPPGCRDTLSKPDDRERFTAHPVLAR